MDQPSDVVVLDNTVRHYAWGSRTHIPRFLGVPAADDPSAELWLGAHPGAPSRIASADEPFATLAELIAAWPEETLGASVFGRFGARLPFLMKVLAAAEPLSLQVHPSSERARAGFAREDQAGVPRDAPFRNYVDESHKPEMIFALTRFEGMAGFRDVEHSARLLRLLRHPWADDVARRLTEGPAVEAVRSVVTDLLHGSDADLPVLLKDLTAAADDARTRLHREESYTRPPTHEPDLVQREAMRVFEQLCDLVERYPADPGVLVTLLLNHVVLAPGEAMFLDAGVVHAYTRGLGVEIMASSDNVLRAGLTPKHVDVEELLHTTDFTPIPAPYWNRVDLGETSRVRLEPPVAEFALDVAHAPIADLPAHGPRIVLVLEGEVEISTAHAQHVVRRGQSVFVPHHAGSLEVTGQGRVAVASVPERG